MNNYDDIAKHIHVTIINKYVYHTDEDGHDMIAYHSDLQ